MLSSLWNFVKRHHRKGLVTCAVVGGGAMVTKYAIEKLQERRQKDMMEYFEQFRRDNHYETTHQTCNQTTLALVNNLRTSIVEILNSDSITTSLKSRPSNKIELWEELKLVAFTRVAISIYGNAMLVLLLRIQINIVGGYLYLNSMNPNGNLEEVKSMSSTEMQEKFLDCVHHFLHDGIIRLIEIMKPVVGNIVNSIGLKEKLTLTNLIDIFKQIRWSFENVKELPLTNLSSYAISSGNKGTDKNGILDDDLSLNQILNETRDILHSEDCIRVLSETVDVGFAHLSDLLTGFYSQTDGGTLSSFVNPHEVSVPLAKLIPALNNLIFVQCSDQPKHLCESLLHFGMLKSFGANVYDAFSKPCSTKEDRGGKIF